MMRVELKINPEELSEEEMLKVIRDLLLVHKMKYEALHDTILNALGEFWNAINGKKTKRR